MTDRDEFAAAAMTGLLAGPGDKDFSMEYWARHAYGAADAMLRERERNGAVSGCETPTLTAEEREAIERLQRSVTDWQLEAQVHRKRAAAAVAEIARLRLTAAEREAIEWCLSLPMLDRDAVRMMPLRKLLERLK